MIEVINPGLFTTVQDYGRWGYQAFGVSVAGVMDRLAYKTANLLLDNDEQAAVLEFTMLGGEYKFLTNSWIALSGADMEARLNGNILQNWAVSKVQANDILTLGCAQAGCRAYLAVAGGYDAIMVAANGPDAISSALQEAWKAFFDIPVLSL